MLDTHLHLWDPARLPYSWLAGIPLLNRAYTVEDYIAASNGTAVTKAIFMECDVAEPHQLEEARLAQQLADERPFIVGLVASCRPEYENFRRHLEAIAALPKARGVRRILHTQPDALSQSELFANNIRLLAEFALTFDLCILARQLPAAIALVKRCPEVTFILDHCGVPDVKGRAFEPWRKDIATLAGLSNVVCKISGLIAYADTGWTADDLRPWFDHVVSNFGWDRVLWGGDWPVCLLGGPLARWIEATRSLCAAATPEQRDALYTRNAERIYRV